MEGDGRSAGSHPGRGLAVSWRAHLALPGTWHKELGTRARRHRDPLVRAPEAAQEEGCDKPFSHNHSRAHTTPCTQKRTPPKKPAAPKLWRAVRTEEAERLPPATGERGC